MNALSVEAAARQYLRAGLALVPIPSGHKAPRTMGWNKPENLVTEVSQASRLAGCNLGLAHTVCKPFPTCAVDIDDYQATVAWLQSEHGISIEALLYAAGTAVCSSGTPNRLKIFYRLPNGVAALATKQLKSGDGQMMVEFRCAGKNGATMQDVLPPSLHPSGNHYQWVGNGGLGSESAEFILTELPACLLKVWLDEAHSGQNIPKRGPVRTETETVSAFRWVATMDSPRARAVLWQRLGYISADCDYETYRAVVWAILDTGWTCAVETAKHWSQSAPHRFDSQCFSNLVTNYDSCRYPRPTQGTIVHLARLGGYDE